MKVIVALLALAGPVSAQTVSLDAIAGIERLDYTYRFDNDSSFDTAFLVPHFFEQRYERTAPIAGLQIRYRLLNRGMRTAVSFTTRTTGAASDVDTFFQPDGDVATSGTEGDAHQQSLAVSQLIDLRSRGPLRLSVSFSWRRDSADFLPADRIVTHTQPPSETREFITDRELTVSQTFEVGIEAAHRYEPGGSAGWAIETSARLTPALRARLLVQLPDKYPGRDIVFSAAGWGMGARAAASRPLGGVDAGAWASIERAGSWRRTARFSRGTIAAGGLIAFGSRP